MLNESWRAWSPNHAVRVPGKAAARMPGCTCAGRTARSLAAAAARALGNTATPTVVTKAPVASA